MIERVIFEYLVNVLWQLPLLLFATWLLIRVARPPLQRQHLLWLATLACAILLPIRGTALENNASSVASALAPATHHEPEFTPTPINNTITNVDALDSEPGPTASFPRISSYFAMRTNSILVSPRIVHWAVLAYLLLIAFSAIKLLISLVAAMKIRASSVFQPLTLLESSLLVTCARRIHLPSARLPCVRSLVGPASPMVIGIRNPVLLLPENLRHRSDAVFHEQHLIAVLTHELVHIRRRDYLVNLVARIISLPIAWHPAALAIDGRIRQTREMICDAEAAGLFDGGATYARSLLSLAEAIIQPHANVEAVGLFKANRKTLEERIMKLTETQPHCSLTTRITRIAAGTAILVVATTAATTLSLEASGARCPRSAASGSASICPINYGDNHRPGRPACRSRHSADTDSGAEICSCRTRTLA